MTMVWHVEVIWQTDVDQSGDNTDRDDAYSAIVGELGGALSTDGTAEFRRYRSAEICAHELHAHLGLVPSVRLAPHCN